MSKSLFDQEFEELFRLNERYSRFPRPSAGSALIAERLCFGLGLLEDQLVQISLPYLEAGENRIFADAGFLADIKKTAVGLERAISECAPESAMEVWNAVDQKLAAMTIDAKATEVVLLAVVVMAVRCTIENSGGLGNPITVSRSRSHPDFHPKLKEACDVSGFPALFDLSDDSKLCTLAAALRNEAVAK
jgi:hypothetical protein